MTEPTASTDACSADLSCSRCDVLVGLKGLHVTVVQEVISRRGPCLQVTVESPARVEGCRTCGVVIRSRGRREVHLIDTPCFGRPVELARRKRTWRCAEAGCEAGVLTERAVAESSAIGEAIEMGTRRV